MKTNPVLPLVLSLVLWTTLSLAQQDTVTVSYSEEPADSSSFSLKEKYKYFTRATIEEKSMFKVGISQIGYAGYYGFMLENIIAYERKITAPFSVLAQYRGILNGYNSAFGADAGFRYYYALPARIRKGKSANNFSANYFTIQSENTFYSGTGITRINPPQVEQVRGSSHYIQVLYGLQRRLGKYGYIDVNIGYERRVDGRRYFGNRGSLGANFSIGVAF